MANLNDLVNLILIAKIVEDVEMYAGCQNFKQLLIILSK